jgi:hypothetical protein
VVPHLTILPHIFQNRRILLTLGHSIAAPNGIYLTVWIAVEWTLAEAKRQKRRALADLHLYIVNEENIWRGHAFEMTSQITLCHFRRYWTARRFIGRGTRYWIARPITCSFTRGECRTGTAMHAAATRPLFMIPINSSLAIRDIRGEARHAIDASRLPHSGNATSPVGRD